MPIPVPQVQQFDVTPMLSAFASGQQTRIGLEDRQRDYERQAEAALFRAADLADTPEKWSQFVSTLQEQYPDADLSEWSDFSARDAALGQAMDPYQRAQLALSQRQLALQESNAARSRAPTPYTDVARINADLNAGLITEDQANQLLAGLGGEAGPQYQMLTGPVIEEMIAEGVALDPSRPYQINMQTGEIETVGGQSTGFAFDYDPNTGQVTLRQGAGAGDQPAGLNLNESNAQVFSTRMAASTGLLDEFANAGTNIGQRFLNAITPSLFGDLANTSEYRRFVQAEANFITAVLRRESGAAIAEEEYENARRIYIPQPGDDPDTLEQKRQSRELAIQLMANGVAPGFNPYALAGVEAPQAATPPGGDTNAGGGGVVGPGEAPIGTRIQMPDGTIQVKTANGWEPE